MQVTTSYSSTFREIMVSKGVQGVQLQQPNADEGMASQMYTSKGATYLETLQNVQDQSVFPATRNGISRFETCCEEGGSFGTLQTSGISKPHPGC